MSNIVELIPDTASAPLKRPCFRVYDHESTLNGEKLRPGVWYHGTKRDGEGDERPTNEWLCGPLHVEAITRGESRKAHYGRLLRFRNLDSQWLEWPMPGELLAGRPEAILSVLFDMGLKIAHRHRARVVEYIAEQNPKRRITAATATGWHGAELFVTPTAVIGEGEVVYQSESAAVGYCQAGTLQGWGESIAAALPGNPLLQLGIGTAFAGPLLEPLKAQANGGFHLLSDSSNGKSSVLYCAASVWGHGKDFALKWNATANGLEGIAALRNDGLLALDELGLADGRFVGDVVYSVADGIGKQRAGRTGAARTAKRWRVMLFSTGELTLETKMREAGKQIRAGQEVRLVNVSAERVHGVWDVLHGCPNGVVMSDTLVEASITHYGHAGPEFVRQLIAHGDFEQLPATLQAIRERFPASTGQAARVAERFAIVALALELAVGFGLLPLALGEGIESMVELFEGWQAGRGEGPSEDRQILKALADFIDRHGGSRFQPVEAGAIEVRDRAGYWESTTTGRLYLFTRSGLEEATKGFELARVVRALDSVGAIAKRDRGRAQASKRLPDGSTPKLYWINPACLEPGD